MIKETILFVASTGLLIYFVTPSEKPPKTDAAPVEVQKSARPVAETADDGWGYGDDDDTEDESFVFGEPLTSFDNDYDSGSDDKPAVDEEKSESRREADTRPSSPRPTVRAEREYSPNSPAPTEKGGVDNPIILDTTTP